VQCPCLASLVGQYMIDDVQLEDEAWVLVGICETLSYWQFKCWFKLIYVPIFFPLKTNLGLTWWNGLISIYWEEFPI
jgi:hypothetical protein